MVFSGAAHDRRAQQWSMGQVEWTLCFVVGETMEFKFAFFDGAISKVHDRQMKWTRLGDDLPWLVVEHLERGTQDLMAAQQLGERLLECLYIERPGHAYGS